MKTRLVKNLLATALLFIQLSTKAEDIDLFVSAPPAGSGVPNVLFILDSTANWNTAFTQEIAALKKVFDEMAVNSDGSAKFNVGLMMFGESPVKGGYIRAAIRPMTTADKVKYGSLINSFDKVGDKGANALYAYSMAEAYRYFMGIQEYVGADEPKRDYSNNTTGTAQSKAIYALSGNAFSDSPAVNDRVYNKPSTVDGCAKNFIIYISNGKVDNSDKEDVSPQCGSDLKKCTARQLLELASGKTFTASTALPSAGQFNRIAISPSGEAINMSDEWARFLKSSSLGITTYTIDVGTPDSDHTALLKSMASVSDGVYYSASAASSSDIANKINQALTEIQAVNSVFASVSLPVSVSTQGNYRNQVFIGMFRPDADGYPRWWGNLKQYKLGYDTSLNDSVLRLLYDNADSSPTASLSAINNSTGFITGCARSFWTPTSVDTYWTTRPEQNCLSVANSDASNYPDGNVVEKGAQAYKLRSGVTRTVKTCSSTWASCTSLVDFNNTNVTTSDLGASSTTERDNLIKWAKGLDTQDEDIDTVKDTEMRLSAHGDVVHSRPVAINFGTDASPKVVVFYGSNDGMLRAINGNRSASFGTPAIAAGAEIWAFLPPEFYSGVKRIYDNSTQISFPTNATVSPTPLPKQYGMDGPIVAYQGTSNTWIYASMRRGGRVIYAFDVTNASPTAVPTLKWKRGCSKNFKDVRTGLAADRGTVDTGDVCSTGAEGDWSGIGQTWSAPTVITAAGYTSGSPAVPLPMLIMGGGYDTCHDSDPNTGCSSSSKGTKIYLLNADTGYLLKTFDTESSVVAELTVVPDDQGRAKYIYAVDLGGNVYRISGASASAPIGSTAPASWTLTKIAVLGGTGTDNRKFMFKPDVVVNGASGGYSILVGSGDREKPLLSYTNAASVTNYFFMLVDKPSTSTWLSSENATCGGNYLCLSSLLGIAWNAGNPTTASLDAKKGWYLGLRPNEQVVTSAITVYNNVTFSTHRPYGSTPAETQSDGQTLPTCGSNLGTAKVYNVNYANASPLSGGARAEVIIGGGLPPSPVAGMVQLDNGSVVPFIIGGKGTSPLEGGSPTTPTSTTRPKGRLYWYIQK